MAMWQSRTDRGLTESEEQAVRQQLEADMFDNKVVTCSPNTC